MGYTSTDQVETWNGSAVKSNQNGDITQDPADGQTYDWDLRNQLEVVGGGWDGMIYDPTGRRDDLPTGSAGTGLSNFADTYLYDGSQGIQASNNTATVNYLRMPGSGEELMEETQSQNGNGAPQIPLLDANGSTIAMVDSGSGSVVSNYTYDPLGKVTYNGSYISAYQYRGMENDIQDNVTWAYHGSNGYYSPILGRPLTIQGPITSAGGFGAGPGAMVAGALPGSDPSGLGLSLNPEQGAESLGVAAGVGAGVLGVNYALASMEIGFAIPGPGWIAAGAGFLYDIFSGGLFGGGGPSTPPWMSREEKNVGGSPTRFAVIEGLGAGYPINQGKSASSPRLELVTQHGTPRRPLAKTQKSLEPGTCQGNWMKVAQETFLGNACICYSLCVPCGGSVM